VGPENQRRGPRPDCIRHLDDQPPILRNYHFDLVSRHRKLSSDTCRGGWHSRQQAGIDLTTRANRSGGSARFARLSVPDPYRPASLCPGRESALFPKELTVLHVKPIWFPFGVDVSRTQYALAALDLPLFALLLRRLHRLARPAAAAP